ncbi:glycoside hydrolase family 130 protein [Acidothermaceae bacterium B102]|nr:glycoside hydrolase family 130 protein [Acidothermaceae bacterium B102]
MSGLAHHVDADLRPDPGRVIAKLFLPGEELPQLRSRAGAIVARVLALPEDEVVALTEEMLADFSSRHLRYREGLLHNASMIKSHIPRKAKLSVERRLLLGACFTAEYSVEGAALCNPSAVLHPDQSGTVTGQVRAAVSLRAIGEGHISTIGFASALVGPGAAWAFEPRSKPLLGGTSSLASWRREHLRAVLDDQGKVDELSHTILAELPDQFSGLDLQAALAAAQPDLLGRQGVQATVELLRQLVASAYEVSFPDDIELSQQTLMPSAAEESNGMEDARFVRFVGDDGSVEYRATYTAYDGKRIAPRLLTSPDLRAFAAHRLAGPAARNKGMAMFPRLVGGLHLSLCRSDGESTSLATSPDGFVWGKPQLLAGPTTSWEVLQVGNCGPPIETEHGWLVLTHGVGPMRAYAIGAFLLDLDDPSKVVKRLDRPLLTTRADEREGYVPNVVYSCGGIVHDGRVWIPYGIGDARISVAWADVDELVDAMSFAG